MMINQYSSNLDAPQDYLVHGKLGAHYSKNWTKEKQNEYNKWYYQHNKDKWKDQQDAEIQNRLENIKNTKGELNKSERAEARYLRNASANDANAETYEIASRNRVEAQEGNKLGHGSSYKAKARKERDTASRYRTMASTERAYRDRLGRSAVSRNQKSATANDLKRSIQADKSKLSNIAKFEVDRTARKASNAVKNIKSSISSVANKVLNSNDDRKTLNEYGYKKAKKNTKQISNRISFTTYD
jgi:hypothetical protein